MHRLNHLFIVTLLATCFASNSYGDSQTAAQKLIALLTPIQSLKAKFTQSVTDINGVAGQEQSGNFILNTGGKFYWEVNEPFPQKIISNAEEIWIYDPDLEQVTIKKSDQDILDTPLLLFSDNAEQASEKYIINTIDINGSIYFELIPQSDGIFERLLLSFEGETPKQLSMFDSLQQETTISFSNLALNPEIDNTVFDFKIPEDTDIFRE